MHQIRPGVVTLRTGKQRRVELDITIHGTLISVGHKGASNATIPGSRDDYSAYVTPVCFYGEDGLRLALDDGRPNTVFLHRPCLRSDSHSELDRIKVEGLACPCRFFEANNGEGLTQLHNISPHTKRQLQPKDETRRLKLLTQRISSSVAD